MMIEENVNSIKEIVFKERKTINEINSLWLVYLKNSDDEEKKMVKYQIEQLKTSLKKTNNELLNALDQTSFQRPLKNKKEVAEIKKDFENAAEGKERGSKEKEKISVMDKEILKRLKKGEGKAEKIKEKKPSNYIKIANNIFGKYVNPMIKDKRLATLEKDLIKSNLNYTSISYISALILTTIISLIVAVLLALFFLFFNITPDLPIITKSTEQIGSRLLKVFWLVFVIPIITFLFMYFYPSLEKKALETKIELELPFATIHMAAISGSLIEPTKVFSIISSTKEYPNLEREFNKLLNEINVYGYDIVTALKNLAINCPSAKLSELFNGLATTITSGGDLYDFFDKRSQTLLFEYRLDKEKTTKSAETFMDIYISVVIAAPMIIMLLLMMMQISGLGMGLSTSMLTFLVVGGVVVINIFFLIFLQLKQPETA
jgi:pilus assembly protein TadC